MTSKINKGTALMAFALTAAISGAQGISVTVDDRPVQFRTTGPRYIDGRVLVPLRGVFEEMGAYVQWRPARREVTASRGDRDVQLNIGSRYATVDGQRVTLDVPAQIINGATMVPIRFLSESLGAEVRWNDPSRTVMIMTDGTGRAQRIDRDRDNDGIDDRDEREVRRNEVLTSETVIPVRLDTRLSSRESRNGDRFTATIGTDGRTVYGSLPAGTRIEGRVVTARPQSGKDPGVIELDFQRLRLPNGRAYAIDGQLISLDNNSVIRDENGTLRSRGSATARDNRTVYAGYGAGAGLIVGLLTKRPLEGAILGGILGYLGGEAERSRNRPSDVTLAAGTEFGVRLTRDVAINARDLR